MSKELTVRQATRLLRAITLKKTTRRSRIHQNAGWESEMRIKAINGICGQCSNMVIKPTRAGGHKSAQLFCEQGHNPINLIESTPFGETPDCPDFTEKK